MKRTLLILSSLLMTVAAFAQWTKPVPAHADSFKYSTFAEGGDTVVYYLYNKDAGAFFTEGNDWGTRASFASTGLKVAIEKYAPVDSVTNEAVWDGKTLLIHDFTLVKGGWYLLFIEGQSVAYVDRAAQANYFWEIEDCGSGTYRIFPADVNPSFNSAAYGPEGGRAYFGVDSNTKEEGGTTLTPLIDVTDDTGAQVDWYFVTEDAYAAYLVENARYEAAAALKTAIDKATEYGLNVTEYQNVYNNTSSTAEQLSAAAAKLNGDIADAAFIGATEDNPYDATGWIVNPSFDNQTINGWDTTFAVGKNAAEVGFQNNDSFTNGEATLNGFMQAWDGGSSWNSNVNHRALGVGQLSQTIKNMPQGKYKFTVDAIACYEPTKKIEDVAGVELFAVGGTVDIHENIATARAPEHYEITFINTGGDITMGVRTTEECTVTWIALDNFTLTYYGKTEEDPYRITLANAISNALKTYPLESLDEVVAYTGDKEAYVTALESAQAATGDYSTYETELKTAVSNLSASKDAYAAYVALVNSVNDYFLTHDIGEAGERVSDYVMEGNEIEPDENFPNGSAAYILSNLALTTEQITAETDFLKNMFNEAKNSGIEEGDDITARLENPNFDDAMNGWEYDSNYSNADGKMSYTADPLPIADGWYNNFDVYQTLVGVPNGIYKLQVQAFYREVQNSTSSYENYIADPEGYVVPAYIYANNSEKSINSIASKTFAEGELEGGFEEVAEGIYLPNNNRGVYNVFTAGYYDNEVYGIVSDRTLKVGIKSLTASGAGRWVAFDNFRVTYIGNDETLYAQITSEKVEALKKVIEANKDYITSPVLAEANKVVESAGSISSAAQAVELLNNVNAVTTAITENVAAVQAYPNAYNRLVEVLDAVGASKSIASSYPATVSNLDTEAINALLTSIAEVIANAPAKAGYALVEDVIVNPTFEEDVTDWNNGYIAGETCNNSGWQSTPYSNTAAYEEVSISNFIEAWNGEGTLGDASIDQIISALPAGVYLLAADAIATDQISDEPQPVTGAYLFAQEGDNAPVTAAIATGDGQPSTFYVKFTKTADDSDLTIGVYTAETTANWLAADNFRLYKLGDITAIKNVCDAANASAVSAIYTVSGNRVSKFQKGVNIVKSADGKVQKVFVK